MKNSSRRSLRVILPPALAVAIALLAAPLGAVRALAFDPCGSEPPSALDLQTQMAPLTLDNGPLPSKWVILLVHGASPLGRHSL